MCPLPRPVPPAAQQFSRYFARQCESAERNKEEPTQFCPGQHIGSFKTMSSTGVQYLCKFSLRRKFQHGIRLCQKAGDNARMDIKSVALCQQFLGFQLHGQPANCSQADTDFSSTLRPFARQTPCARVEIRSRIGHPQTC